MFLELKNLDLLSVGVAIAASMILGFMVYYQNRSSLTNRIFLWFCLVSCSWGAANYLSYHVQRAEVALWLIRLVIFFAIIQAYTFFLFAITFPVEKMKYVKWLRLGVFPAVVFVALLNLTPFVFESVMPQDQAYVAVTGPAIPLFGFFAVSLVVAGVYMLVSRALKASGELRAQYNFFIFGVGTMFTLIIAFNFIMPTIFHDSRFIPYGALFIFPFVASTAYAILKHRLLNIKVVSADFLVGILAVTALLDVIFSQDLYTLIFRISVFILVLSFGVLLIRSVLNEVRQRLELENLSKQLGDANFRLQEMDQAKTEFLSVASHQLRTPLTAIKGYTSMFLEGDFGQLTEEQLNSLKIIFESSERMVGLINDLLDVSRIEGGRLQFDFEAVDLCEVVNSVIEELGQKAKARKLYLYFDNINGVCPQIKADKDKMRQVVMNLVDNAIKYTVSGGVTIRLIVMADKVRLSVADTGIGISVEDSKKIFQKYFRTQAANEVTHEGTGIGVYVVKKIVEAHKGSIWFESQGVGKGTVFYVTLPIPVGPIKAERLSISALEAI